MNLSNLSYLAQGSFYFGMLSVVGSFGPYSRNTMSRSTNSNANSMRLTIYGLTKSILQQWQCHCSNQRNQWVKNECTCVLINSRQFKWFTTSFAILQSPNTRYYTSSLGRECRTCKVSILHEALQEYLSSRNYLFWANKPP